MPRRIAVERTLGEVADHLAAKGFEVARVDARSLAAQELEGYAAFVISGQDANVTGRADITTAAPVIDATGKTAAEVASALQRRLKPLH